MPRLRPTTGFIASEFTSRRGFDSVPADQHAGTPVVWQARHRLFECQDYLNQTRACIETLGLDPDMAGRIWEKTRQRGPEPSLSVSAQVQQFVDEFVGK